MDREKVIKGLECCLGSNDCDIEPEEDCPYKGMCLCAMALRLDVLALLKEQDELLRKLQKDKDKLCLEVSEWKHKFHDAPPKFVSQGVVDQIRWERDTALSQLEQIGKGLGSKMDDIVALLKEQKTAMKPKNIDKVGGKCPVCGLRMARNHKYCYQCGQEMDWE